MAGSAALNPTSMPFFPGGLRSGDEDGTTGLGFRLPAHLEQDRASVSSHSISPSDYRSIRSSPSPPQDGVHSMQRSPSSGEESRSSPALRQAQADRAYPTIETGFVREFSHVGSFDGVPDGEETPGGPLSDHKGALASNGGGTREAFFTGMFHTTRDTLGTPPVPSNTTGSRASSFNNVFLSSSPVSSLGSSSHITSSGDHFESQLKGSPLINEILERLVRCEVSNREIQRELVDVHRKIDILVERSLDSGGYVEFKDPFASASVGLNHHHVNSGMSTARGSVGGIAPHQTPDDIAQLSQRLDMITTSMGQMIALQTQQFQAKQLQNVGSGNHISGSSTPQMEMSGNPIQSPPLSSSSAMLGHGLPTRPDVRSSSRTPNPPLRTWSTGNLDLPMRSNPDITASLGRQDNSLRDKRRSVVALTRRESSGGESLANGSRDGPMISKWEQLPLSADLLRSLSKFGVGPPNKIQQRALPFLLRGSDIIAQAPPTQERIAAYVIPAIQTALTYTVNRPPNRGPIVLMISTTVDQATQAQRMIRDLGGPIGIRSALGVGSSSVGSDLNQEVRLLQQSIPHIICGTPQKLHALFTSPGGLVGSEVRFLVIDEVDQLIARNLHDFVFNIVKLLPPPRSRSIGPSTPTGTPGQGNFGVFESGLLSPFPNQPRRFSGVASPNPSDSGQPERQTALFSNTVPQDVLNLASAIQLREPVRVLVRRDGNVTHADTNQGARGLRQFYLYLAFTAGGRAEPLPATPGGGLGIIGSGRSASSAETAQAKEWKLDALADLFDDIDVPQAIVHVGGMNALDSVVYKLASRGLEAVPLHGDMNAGTKLAALNKFRTSTSSIMRQPVTKVLIVYDVQVKTPEVSQIPLVINYDLPKAVEEYSSRVQPAMAPNHGRAGVVVNFVTATGGDVEMLRSIECFYKIKCPEVPMSLRDIV